MKSRGRLKEKRKLGEEEKRQLREELDGQRREGKEQNHHTIFQEYIKCAGQMSNEAEQFCKVGAIFISSI